MTTRGTVLLRRTTWGCIVAIGLVVVLGAVMFLIRSHVGDATVALVLVVPVVAGVVLGGVLAGSLAVVAGFLIYDFVFIPPYYTFRVGSPRNWVALLVYFVVVTLVARVVDRLKAAEEEAHSREADAARLLEVSEVLIEEHPLPEFLTLVASMAREAFACESVVLLLPHDDVLEVAVTAGRDLSPDEVRRVTPAAGVRSALTPQAPTSAGGDEQASSIETIVLTARGRPVGILGFVGTRLSPHRRSLAVAFANNIAVAIERAQLQEQALRMHVLEQVDRLRGALIGAVSHDLRTPLATIKTSASVLLDQDTDLDRPEQAELLKLIDEQADRLARLVTNLLDMSRIEAGALVVHRQPLHVNDVIKEAIGTLRPLVGSDRVEVNAPDSLPSVYADHVLVHQVIVNLLENALRYAPSDTAVKVSATAKKDMTGKEMVEIAVSDSGPGISDTERARLGSRGRVTAGPGRAAAPPGGSGVGLAIARAFVEANGGRIAATTPSAGGTRIVFSLPVDAREMAPL